MRNALNFLFNGLAIRGPVPDGSICVIAMVTGRKTSVEEINAIFEEESESDRYRGIVAVSRDLLASSDIIMQPYASIVDLTLTQVVDGDLVKVLAWYDNEWGYASQMVREAQRIIKEP